MYIGGAWREMSYRSSDSIPCTTGTWGNVVCQPPVCEDNESNNGLVDCVVGQGDNRCCVLARISSGSFGLVYKGRMESDDELVAIKAERNDVRNHNQVLLNEGNVYRQLKNGPGIPCVYWYGMHHSGYNALVMDLLGPSLQEVFVKQRSRFSLKTVLLLADQILQSLEFIHTRGFIHRDISSNNFMLGYNDPTRIYLIDFGHAKKFATGFYFKPMQRQSNLAPNFVGTPRFASLSTHMGKEPGRKDDLESLGYLFVFFLKGSLPWQGLRIVNSAAKLAKIAQIKSNISATALCDGLPKEFANYMEALRMLNQMERPPYAHINAAFSDLAKQQNISYDGQFDWVKKEKMTDGMDNCCDIKTDVRKTKSDSVALSDNRIASDTRAA